MTLLAQYVMVLAFIYFHKYEIHMRSPFSQDVTSLSIASQVVQITFVGWKNSPA
jgi:hypothetical protein